jgi:hypothetical protein
MNNETFWNSLERNFADEDNERFDNERLTKQGERNLRRLKIKVVCGLLAATLVTAYVVGVIIFNALPDLPA